MNFYWDYRQLPEMADLPPKQQMAMYVACEKQVAQQPFARWRPWIMGLVGALSAGLGMALGLGLAQALSIELMLEHRWLFGFPLLLGMLCTGGVPIIVHLQMHFWQLRPLLRAYRQARNL